MKFLGEKSLSSILYRLSYLAWYLVIFGFFFLCFILSVAMFAEPLLTPGETPWEMFKYELFSNIKADDDEAWKFFTTAPVLARAFALFFIATATVLMLDIIHKSRKIFKNFMQNVVFHDENVRMISRVSKLLLVFSIITINFASLLVSAIFLILIDVFKSGSMLQKEYDLTV